MLTIAPLKRRSIAYYNDTARAATAAAMDRQRAGGGLGEYYSEGETRAPVWRLVGDREQVAQLTGLGPLERAGGAADLDVVERWMVDGIAPNGAMGRAFGEASVRGFDLVFCAPKSVSMLRALTADPVTAKALDDAHNIALTEALEYLADHAGYTRVHNPATGKKDLIRLPGLAAAAYQHETSRAGDPHLHTHVLVPNKQARADGALVSLDSTSLFHEARAAGLIYQATLRRELHQSMAMEFDPVDPHTGQADIAGIDPAVLVAGSRRSTQLHEWAQAELVVDGAKASSAQLAAAQKATRPVKPEHTPREVLVAAWRAQFGHLELDPRGQAAARHQRLAETRNVMQIARAAAADIVHANPTRADLIEAVTARLPVDIDGVAAAGPRELAEVIVNRIAIPITAPREAHHREGNTRYTTAQIITEEAELIAVMGLRSTTAALPARAVDTEGLSAEQSRVITAIATAPWLVQPLSAPAGAGKTTSLKALRTAVHASPTHDRVIVVAPTGKAVDVAVQEGAGDTGGTIDSALAQLRRGSLHLDARTLIVVDEAGMVGTPHLRELLAATTTAGAKTVLVGDPHQLAPVKARGGMFEQLCTDLPWTQELTEVWRMRDPEERAASLKVRSGGAGTRRRAVDWYRRHDRLRTGDEVTMADDAMAAYTADKQAGKDALLVADGWEMCDALNLRIHHDTIAADAPTIGAARGHQIAVGDVVISRLNDPDIPVLGARDLNKVADPVRNGHRWTVIGVDPETQHIGVRRLSDGAHAIFEGDYLRNHVHLGYAVTVHAAQGATADTTHTLLSAQRAHKALAYVGLTRGRDTNHAYLYTRDPEEADHAHTDTTPGVHVGRRGTGREAAALLAQIIGRDTRAHTAAVTAADTDCELLPEPVSALAAQRDRARTAARIAHHRHTMDQELTAELPRLHAEVAQSEASWGRSPATVYPPPAHGWDGIDDQTRAAVTTITASMQNTHVLTIGEGGAKHAALAAVAAAAHGTNRHVLILPATKAAFEQYQQRPYAGRAATPHRTHERLEKGEWAVPAGSLVVIDDADQLDPKLLRYYTDHATATNTKLLLVHTPDAGRHPAHTVIDALADTLPWTHQIGTPSLQQGWRTATDHVTDLLAQPRCGAPTKAASAAAELLDRRARPLNSYLNTQAQQHHWAHRHKQRDRERVHDRGGLEL